MTSPINVAVTGCSGHIAYSFLAELAKGWVFGENQFVNIIFIERENASTASQGIIMELEDCAFPLLNEIEVTTSQQHAFSKANYVVLLGALPRGPGMDRSDLLSKNEKIFQIAGQNLELYAQSTCKVLVVGNPANTNAMVLAKYAPKLLKNIAAMSQLDHNRAIGQISKKCNVSAGKVKGVFVFGNHSNTMVPIFTNVEVDNQKVEFEQSWIEETTKIIQMRGGSIIQARGASSALSAAHGALDCIKHWFQGTSENEIVSVSIAAEKNNFYEIPEGIFCSVPCECKNGQWIVKNMKIEDQYQPRIAATIAELLHEKQLAGM